MIIKICIALSFLCAVTIVLMPASRYWYYSDQGDSYVRVSDCEQSSSQRSAPTEYSVSAIGWLFGSKPITNEPIGWGTCPYSAYKAKSFAAEFWVIGLAGILYLRKNKQSVTA